MNKLAAYQHDWNPCTVEGYDQSNKEVTMIFNFDITTSSKTEAVIHYVVGRLIWGINNFPENVKVRLSFDVRGQGIIISRSTALKNVILQYVNDLNITNAIEIEFFR